MSIEAYDYGKKDGTAEEQERIIKLIEEEIRRVSNPMLVDREYLDGLEVAIELIKKEANSTEPEKKVVYELPKPELRCGVNACGCGKGEV